MTSVHLGPTVVYGGYTLLLRFLKFRNIGYATGCDLLGETGWLETYRDG